jgi:phenylpropionate dioxygenase-like ring-hydroxylating dioxygenase large terminal subunit
MNLSTFWYVVAESRELPRGTVLPRKVLGEWLAVFRGEDGAPAVLRDRCMHRASRLSRGRVEDGCLRCPYHGWLYRADGSVAEVPAEGPEQREVRGRRTLRYEACEQDGFVYVRLQPPDTPAEDVPPFRMPHWGEDGWHHVRLQNRFRNNVTNCVENFIDVPHTVFVHPGIFRTARGQPIRATITREAGRVTTVYEGETDNLGWFAWFLNPGGHPIEHSDTFALPNVTHVRYHMGPRRTFYITSQSVPVEDDETLVYTDLTYDYGWVSPFIGPVVAWQSQAVIDQDIVALGQQMEVIRRYGDAFQNTPADIVHVLVESIREALARGEDPRELPVRTHTVTFHA